jgi:hypothetical protein
MRAHERGAWVRHLTVLALVAFASVTACTSSELDSPRASSKGISSDGSSVVHWGSCPDDYFVHDLPESFDRSRVDCASIDVPAVYGQDSGLPDFRLAMMRVHATGDAEKLGTLFVNPGGPGGSGIEAIQYQPFPQAIQDSYDIVGFDPRGVLHSQPVSGEPIRCSDELDFASYWTLELSPASPPVRPDELERRLRARLDASAPLLAPNSFTSWCCSTSNEPSGSASLELPAEPDLRRTADRRGGGQGTPDGASGARADRVGVAGERPHCS